MTKSSTFRFRDFEIYKHAKLFRREVLSQINNFPSHQKFSLVQQIDRASYSVLLNIAEGSARTTDRDFRNFLVIAVASVSEVIAGFDCALDDGYISITQMNAIEKIGEHLARQIGAFIKKLS